MTGMAAVQVDVSRVERTSAGLVDAGIHVRMDDVAFPHEAWTDFAVVVIGWWTEALIKLLDGDLSTQEVRFMDGPYLVRIAPADGDRWQLQFVEALRVPRVRHHGVVDPVHLVESVVAAADALLELCRARGWGSRDSEHLAALVSRLRER